MGSTLTQVIAARVPNREAELLRTLAKSHGLTVSDLIKAALEAQAADKGSEKR